MTTRAGALRDHLVLGTVLAAVGVLLHLSWARAVGMRLGLPLDDSWIHAAFARNLASGAGWTLFAGGPGGGESSPLWPWLLTPGEWGGLAAAPLLALMLGCAAWLILPATVGALHPVPSQRRALTVAVAMMGPLLFHALSGMETLPALTLGCLGLLSFAQGNPRRAALWIAGASLLRPDASLLGLVLLVGELDHRREAGDSLRVAFTGAMRDLWPAAAGALVAVGGLAFLEGRFPPSTLAGRRWLQGLPPGLDLLDQGAAIRHFLTDWGYAVSADLGFGRFSGSVPSGVGSALRWTWKFLAAAVAVSGLLRLLRDAGRPRDTAALRLLLVWALWMLLVYAVLLPDRGHVGRYQPQLYLVLAALGVSGVRQLSRFGRGVGRVAGPVAATLLLAGLALSVVQDARLWTQSVGHLNRVHAPAARVAALLPAPARVAVFDVGIAAYRSRRPMLDLSGLSDPSILDDVLELRLSRTLRDRGVTHVLLPLFDDDGPRSLRGRLGLLEEDGVTMTVVDRWESADAEWGESFQYAGHAFRGLRLYRVDAIDPWERDR